MEMVRNQFSVNLWTVYGGLSALKELEPEVFKQE